MSFEALLMARSGRGLSLKLGLVHLEGRLRCLAAW